MKKFWNWTKTAATETEPEQRVLHLNGAIADESWFDDDVTPAIFREELQSGSGDVTVWINSPGGDCIAAAQIYNMMMDYKGGKITVKIDGIAASAASVIAMAGDKVLMSPVATMMIHNPMTVAFGNKEELKKAIEMLDAVKETIINAYEIKTGLSRDKISRLMDSEFWMPSGKAIELGFADGVISRGDYDNSVSSSDGMSYSRAAVTNSLIEKIAKRCRIEKKPDEKPEENTQKPEGRSVDELLRGLETVKNYL